MSPGCQQSRRGVNKPPQSGRLASWPSEAVRRESIRPGSSANAAASAGKRRSIDDFRTGDVDHS